MTDVARVGKGRSEKATDLRKIKKCVVVKFWDVGVVVVDVVVVDDGG